MSSPAGGGKRSGACGAAMDCDFRWLDFAAGLWLGLFVAWLYSLIVYRKLKRIAAALEGAIGRGKR